MTIKYVHTLHSNQIYTIHITSYIYHSFMIRMFKNIPLSVYATFSTITIVLQLYHEAPTSSHRYFHTLANLFPYIQKCPFQQRESTSAPMMEVTEYSEPASSLLAGSTREQMSLGWTTSCVLLLTDLALSSSQSQVSVAVQQSTWPSPCITSIPATIVICFISLLRNAMITGERL